MADGRITLIDVMRGIRKHGLIDRMSEECFTFLIGIILEANELGFKNPIGLTVSQALPIGGGRSRQTLNGRRKSLAKVKVDGKQLVKVKAGNKGQNSVATYEIDYISLCSYNGVWQEIDDLPSNKLDNSSDKPDTRHHTPQTHVGLQPADHPKIREEERREDVGGDGGDFQWLLREFQNVAPGWSIQNDTQRQKMIEFSETPREKLEAILKRAAERGEKGERLISWVDGGLEDFDRLYNGVSYGDGQTKADVLKDLKFQKDHLIELQTEQAEDTRVNKHPEDWDGYIKATKEHIAELEAKL